MINKPFAESCEQNKAVIFETIRPWLDSGTEVLELGSGTGQHAIHFATKVPGLVWQTSDLAMNLGGIKAWTDEAGLPGLREPIELDASADWPDKSYDLIYSANTFHIMSHNQVEQCLLRCTRCLNTQAHLVVYGPFNYQGRYTSMSNQNFDDWLKSRDAHSGIKDFEWVNRIASESGLRLTSDIAMPANNRILIWQNETIEAVC